MICPYCNEKEASINIKDFMNHIIFFTKDFKSFYWCCENCFNTLQKEGNLTTKHGSKLLFHY